MARQPFDPFRVKPDKASQKSTSAVITVAQLTALVRQAIDAALPATVRVLGEISNFKRHGSGHLYFTLKDAASELSCVMWRSAAEALKFEPRDGLEVIATGTVEVFERAGRYQLYARRIEPRGLGALELAFRQLCERLSAEGLFDAARKRALPMFPRRVAIVTSPTGAAIADMLRTIERRFPCLHVIVVPVRVQGEGAAGEIAHAVRLVNERVSILGGVDVIIVGRGGGSMEDLWSFNEEVVARAIHASEIPVVSAVGHEVDVTVSDLVADVRAATPTAGAELVAPKLEDVLADLRARTSRIGRAIAHRIRLREAGLHALVSRRAFREPLVMISRRGQLVDEWMTRFEGGLTRRLARRRERLAALEMTVRRIAPHRHLYRQAMRLRDAALRLERAARGRLHVASIRVTRAAGVASPARLGLLVGAEFRSLGDARDTLDRAMRHRLAMACEWTHAREARLKAIGYESVLARGFSVTRRAGDRTLVRSISQLRDHDRVVTRVADGEFESRVVELNQRELFE